MCLIYGLSVFICLQSNPFLIIHSSIKNKVNYQWRFKKSDFVYSYFITNFETNYEICVFLIFLVSNKILTRLLE